MDADASLPPKREVAEAVLERGTLFLHLDPRCEGVRVPEWLSGQPQLVLQVGYQMPIPIPDLRIDEAGIVGTLSFNRAPFTCEVPWAAVFALVGDDGRGMVWPESMPGEIAAEIEREALRRRAQAADPAGTKSQRKRRPSVRSNRGPSAPAAPSERSRSARPPTPTSKTSTSRNTGSMADDAEEATPRNRTLSGRRLPPYLRVIK